VTLMTRLLTLPVLLLTLAALLPLPARAADEPKVALKKGDRIIFLGDSITQGGGGPQGYITLIKKALDEKHKALAIETVNAGISGNKVPDLQRRLDRDVLAKKPNVVFIYIGINDVWHGENDPARGTPKDKFELGLREVIGKITDAGAQVIVCTPTVIGEKKDGANKLDKQLDDYAAISRRLAKELKLPLCDLRQAFVEHIKANNVADKDRGVLTGDRVHLNAAGNKLVADTMLKLLGD